MANNQIIGSELGPEFDQGVAVPNLVTVKTDGTSVARNATTGVLSAAQPTYNPTTKILSFPAVDGVATPDIDLSALAVDVFVDGATLSAGNVLTLTDTSGTTPDVVVDLNALLGSSTDANNLLDDGADGKATFTKADLDAQTTICTSLFGTQLFRGITI